MNCTIELANLANFCSCMLENDLDDEALAVAAGQGPESLREAIRSLSKWLKLIGAVQLLKTFSSNPSSNSNQVIYICIRLALLKLIPLLIPR